VSTLNYLAGETVANAALAPLGPGGLTVLAGVSGADLILDVNGYLAASIPQPFAGGAGNMANAFNGTSNRHGPVFGPASSTTPLENNQTPMPIACAAQELRVRTNRSVAPGEFAAVTLVVNGADTLTCTVAVASAACDSGAATTAIPAGALVAMRLDSVIPAGSIFAFHSFLCS
jgi:hypothetical protein